MYISNTTNYTEGDAVDWMIGEGVDVINYSKGWRLDAPGDGTPGKTNNKERDSNHPLKWVDLAAAQPESSGLQLVATRAKVLGTGNTATPMRTGSSNFIVMMKLIKCMSAKMKSSR